MQCPSCGLDNPEGMKFCGECGAPFKHRCPQCGFENPPRFKFCGECGSPLTAPSSTSKTPNPELRTPDSRPWTLDPRPINYTPKHLAERILAEQAAMEARAIPDGERKTVTALFVDIKNSMGLIEDLDPEEARSIIDPAIQFMMDAVHRYEGYVAQSTGDGIFALFGAPIACEDHPQRAVYAALRMQEESRRYADKLRLEKGVPFHIRVGLNTGDVVMRSIRKDDLHTDYTPIGHSTSLASRMESLATPGSIVVSEHTYKLAEGYFQFKALGAARVKGVSEPLHIYEVLGVGPLRTRLQVAARRGLARFVGRHSELEQMQKAWELTKAGHGQIVAVMGEPGVGKSRLFLEFVGATHASPLQQLILEKTEGNPFFMEEIVQELLERGVLEREPIVGARLRPGFSAGHVPLPTDLHIPPTVQGVLASRIDRLGGAEKNLLQILAVIGKEFPASLLKQVVDQPENELRRLLSHLQTAEFIYEQPAFPEVEYTFKHALTQEVAYNSLLIKRRQVLHERTAKATEALFHSRLEDHYGDLAHHYSRSGNTQKAAEYLQLAGQQATRRSAYAEAIGHLTQGLELLKTLPDDAERARQELALQITLSQSLAAIRGSGAPDLERALVRARELCREVGNNSQLFLVLDGLRVLSLFRLELQTSRELGEQLVALAHRTEDLVMLAEAYMALGIPMLWLGEFVAAREHFERGTALPYSPQHYSQFYEGDSRTISLSLSAWILWFLGYPDQALKRNNEALIWAQELSVPISLAWALGNASYLHQCLRNGRAAQEQAEAAIVLAAEQGFPSPLAFATLQRGWALIDQGRVEEGVAEMRQGIAAFEATGAVAHPFFLATLAEGYGKAGQAEEGLQVSAEVLPLAQKTDNRMYEAELYRLKGELSLKSRQVKDKSKTSQDKSE